MRYNLIWRRGKNPLVLDSKATLPLKDYIYNETRYKSLANADPEVAEALRKRKRKR